MHTYWHAITEFTREKSAKTNGIMYSAFIYVYKVSEVYQELRKEVLRSESNDIVVNIKQNKLNMF